LPTRILIADDHESVRHGIRTMLEANPGWEVCGEAVDGVDAIAKAQELKPDLIVLDFAMPRLDGLKAAASISKDSPEVPIILHTMYGSLLSLEIKKYGISRVVGKSETGSLVRAVQELLEG
jgi:DNA-binding NarL/FixJ family response regulator